MADERDVAGVEGDLEPGTRVEVRSGLDRTWTAGFTVAEATDGGYRLRRRSDDQVLPIVFPSDAVRRERRNNLWWI